MSPSSAFFLRAKHWQIFLLVAGPYLLGTVAMFAAPIQSETTSVRNPQNIFMTMMFLCMVFCLCWFWSMGSFFNSATSPQLRLKSAFFRFAIFYPPLYMLVFIFYLAQPAAAGRSFSLLLPFHFLAVFCMFYDLYFVSKTLVMAEMGKPTSFYDYAGPLFLLWFFPLGIWFTQPRVNRLYAKGTSGEADRS